MFELHHMSCITHWWNPLKELRDTIDSNSYGRLLLAESYGWNLALQAKFCSGGLIGQFKGCPSLYKVGSKETKKQRHKQALSQKTKGCAWQSLHLILRQRIVRVNFHLLHHPLTLELLFSRPCFSYIYIYMFYLWFNFNVDPRHIC